MNDQNDYWRQQHENQNSDYDYAQSRIIEEINNQRYQQELQRKAWEDERDAEFNLRIKNNEYEVLSSENVEYATNYHHIETGDVVNDRFLELMRKSGHGWFIVAIMMLLYNFNKQFVPFEKIVKSTKIKTLFLIFINIVPVLSAFPAFIFPGLEGSGSFLLLQFCLIFEVIFLNMFCIDDHSIGYRLFIAICFIMTPILLIGVVIYVMSGL